MLTNTTATKWSEPLDQSTSKIELIIFDIGEVSFGIPITKIDRIISNIHLDQDHTLTENVTILDLHDQLTGISIVNPTAIAIFTTDQQQSFGIPINTVPTLLAVPLELIRTIPNEFRTTSPLDVASHLALVPMSMTQLTIFILAS